jgi:hypothetical protein
VLEVSSRMELSEITIASTLSRDYPTIARRESVAFAHEEFGKVAFGPHRLTDAAKDAEAKRLAQPAKPGETKRYMKAVINLPDGVEEIVGFAGWTICIGRKGSKDEKMRLGTREGWAQEEREKEEKEQGGKEAA